MRARRAAATAAWNGRARAPPLPRLTAAPRLPLSARPLTSTANHLPPPPDSEGVGGLPTASGPCRLPGIQDQQAGQSIATIEPAYGRCRASALVGDALVDAEGRAREDVGDPLAGVAVAVDRLVVVAPVGDLRPHSVGDLAGGVVDVDDVCAA